LRWSEEENLTQEKEGLGLLLAVDDFLGARGLGGYGGRSKKELLDLYESRILRNA
jgi:hypothetical protein